MPVPAAHQWAGRLNGKICAYHWIIYSADVQMYRFIYVPVLRFAFCRGGLRSVFIRHTEPVRGPVSGKYAENTQHVESWGATPARTNLADLTVEMPADAGPIGCRRRQVGPIERRELSIRSHLLAGTTRQTQSVLVGSSGCRGAQLRR